MIRALITAIARRKNPSFELHANAGDGILFSWIIERTIAFLRGCRLMLHAKAPGLFLGARVRIKGKSCFTYGKSVQIGHDVTLQAYGNKGLTIGDYSWIGSYSLLKVSFSWNDPGEHIIIGHHVGIGEFAHLGGAGGLEIGNDCIIGPYFSCHPENHTFHSSHRIIREQGTERKGIRIGNNCWIGAKVTILDGVTIGDNCVIAAGAVVTRSMPANAVIGGVPAKVIRYREEHSPLNAVQSVA